MLRGWKLNTTETLLQLRRTSLSIVGIVNMPTAIFGSASMKVTVRIGHDPEVTATLSPTTMSLKPPWMETARTKSPKALL